MKPSEPVASATPVCRVPAFAVAVRRRGRLGGASPRTRNRLRRKTIRLRAVSPRVQPSSRVDRVLLEPVRPLERHHWHRFAPPAQRLDLHLTLAVALRTVMVHATGLPPGRPARDPATGRMANPRATLPSARMPALVERAAATMAPQPPLGAPARRDPTRAAASPPGSPAWAAYPTIGTGPTTVPMVQRQQLPAAPAPAAPPGEPAAATAATPLAVRWGDSHSVEATGRAPLTSGDMPLVVEHVVREIDRRLLAARERRGWTG